jgi:flagellar hook-associated protein 3 FlgL
MNVRVTGQVQIAATLANLRRQGAAQARFQDQIASGVAVKAASDSPLEFASLARARESAASFGASLQVAGDAAVALDAGVAALTDGHSILARAKQLAIGAGSPESDRATDEATAQELDGLIARFLDEANAAVDGRYLFSGDKTSTPPFRVAATDPQGRPAAIVYDGSVSASRTDIAGRYAADTRSVGSAVFQSSAGNSFQALLGLRDTLRNTALTADQRVAALQDGQKSLEAAASVLTSELGAKAGASAAIESIQFRLQDQKLVATARSENLGSTDYTEAILRYKQEESAYSATLSVAAKIVPPSLFDLIR